MRTMLGTFVALTSRQTTGLNSRSTQYARGLAAVARFSSDSEQQLPPLVLIGDRELLSPCEPSDVAKIPKMKGKIDILKKCQKAYGGIGIASCQIGWRARVFCMGIEHEDLAAKSRYPGAPEFPFQVWINPTITPFTEKGTSWFWEGCLSVPGMQGWVERPNAIRITGYNEQSEWVEVDLDGLPARVAQHEFDHLEGILFPDKSVPGTLLPTAAFDDYRRERWPVNWPTPGSRKTLRGQFSDER